MRPSRRPHDAFRHPTFSFRGLDRVDASARFGFGEPQCLASLSGPIEVRLQAEQANRATLEVMVRPLSGIPGTSEKSLGNTIRSLLTPSLMLTSHPRTLVQICLQVLSPDSKLLRGDVGNPLHKKYNFTSNPSLTAACINSAGLALLKASSVPMKGVVCAIGVGLHRNQEGRDDIILDPEDSEIPSLVGAGCFAFLFGMKKEQNQGNTLPVGGNSSATSVSAKEAHTPLLAIEAAEIVWSSWEGTFDADLYDRVERLARVGAGQLWEVMRYAVASESETGHGTGVDSTWQGYGSRQAAEAGEGVGRGARGSDRDRNTMSDRRERGSGASAYAGQDDLMMEE